MVLGESLSPLYLSFCSTSTNQPHFRVGRGLAPTIDLQTILGIEPKYDLEVAARDLQIIHFHEGVLPTNVGVSHEAY